MALTARNAAVRASNLAGITDECTALDFDIACTLRLAIYDNEVRARQAQLIAFEVSKLFASDSQQDDENLKPEEIW